MVRAADPCEPAVAELVSVQGAVDVRRGGETRWQPARLGEPLCIGDVVRTGRVSRAALVFVNDSVLRLDQLTELRLRAVAEERRSLLDMMAGAIQFFSRRPRALEIDTPFVTAAAEGTEFFVRVADDGTRVIVFEGRVRVVNPEGELLLADGDAAIVPEGEAPRAEIIVRPRDAVAWALYYPPILSALAERTPRAQALPMGLERAVERVATNDYPGALETLDAVPEAERDVRYWTYRAGVLLNVGRVEEAQAAIDRALALAPDAAGALAQRAVILIAREEEEQALADARRAVELEPNSAPARIALSYAHQARVELEPAREVLREAVERTPDDALAWARLAEVELAFGNLDAAEEAAEQATSLAPELGRTQMVRGFAELVRIDIDEAKAAFERALALDSANPLPRLGLGLARIRESDLEAGRRQIEIAAGLDPNDALVRSYLGKAYFEETREDKAAAQFQVAKQLDPNDPTPWFYNAIRLQAENRPVEALRDLQTSIRLNDNRAVYRSRLLLDQDLAARGARLGRIYNDLGFEQAALVEAWKSLQVDPANHSAHRLLADTYAALPRHEIARDSEILQSQFLQPINIDPVQPRLAGDRLGFLSDTGPLSAGFNEFTRAFVRNEAIRLQGDLVIGNQNLFAEDLIASGIYNRFSYSLGQFHFDSNGFRPNNDLTQDVYDAFAQLQVSPGFSVLTEARHTEEEFGDHRLFFDRDDFSREQRNSVDATHFSLGFRRDFREHDTLLARYVHSRIDTADRDPGVIFDFEEDSDAVELRLLTGRRGVRFDGGLGALTGEIATSLDFGPSFSPIEDEADREALNAYVYADIDLPLGATLIGGVSYESIEDLLNEEQWNPKLGLVWPLNPDTTLRFATFRTLKRLFLSGQTLERTNIAGFNQFFDDFNGTDVWHYGIGLDHRWRDDLLVGAELSLRELEIPALTGEVFDQDEVVGRTYSYWYPRDWLAAIVEYRVERFKAAPEEGTAHLVRGETRLFHPAGWLGRLGGTVGHQSGDFQMVSREVESAHDTFFLLNAAIGYRFPARYGIVSLEGHNLLDERFTFQELDPINSSSTVARERRIWLRLTLTF